ncbi:component of SufBCD complex [Citreimonas sp.]|uniref:component of SufBCD complex n=1 Tax=Citreimonas sp. TaxID=3036715 RepID=UPI0035C7A6B1
MGFYDTVFEFIDMRSFSNLWFWIMLAVVWSSASHWVLGVPFDMVTRARRNPHAAADLESLAAINANRLIFIADEAGLWLTAIASALLTGLALLGFLYGSEFAQAVFLLIAPLSFVFLLSLRTARRVLDTDRAGDALRRRLGLHRILVQAIGLVAIFFTALWGMYQNIASPFL